MNEQQRNQWEKIRSQGKQSFIWLYGVLIWGGLMVVLVTLTNRYVYHEMWMRSIADSVALLFAGYLWGLFLWNWKERYYRNPQD